jgi:hypothetical protein
MRLALRKQNSSQNIRNSENIAHVLANTRLRNWRTTFLAWRVLQSFSFSSAFGSEILLDSVYNGVWNDVTVRALKLCVKCLSAGDLNAKHPFRHSGAHARLSIDKLLGKFDINEFEISASQCTTHCSLVGNGGVLDSVVCHDVIMFDTSHLYPRFPPLVLTLVQLYILWPSKDTLE